MVLREKAVHENWQNAIAYNDHFSEDGGNVVSSLSIPGVQANWTRTERHKRRKRHKGNVTKAENSMPGRAMIQ